MAKQAKTAKKGVHRALRQERTRKTIRTVRAREAKRAKVSPGGKYGVSPKEALAPPAEFRKLVVGAIVVTKEKRAAIRKAVVAVARKQGLVA